ncbi:IS200/IS605 family transposase [Candidatus Poribacteria bacterium]|nr:IS200/IS605 family transposase [Candidatus Poribacteria bacterium]MYG08411.1 IS200/IS605 family transposase [Candidatus Poribacteria bacterium]MYK23726.1 IS200/IS605 family transposase [Candidatus Poribacteria bacterium]
MPLKIANKKRDYRTTNKTVYSCQYHVIWCTKYRRKVLDTQIQGRLKQLIREKQDEYGYQIAEVETQAEHVHLLIEIPPTDSIDKIVGKIKSYSSKILREEYPSLKSRLPSLWTRSKFVSSCGGVTLQVIKDYIEAQSGQ